MLVVTAVALPILLASALAIALDFKGPVFYRPRAIGKGGGQFTIYNRSFDLDLSILFETIFVVLKKKGRTIRVLKNRA